MTSPTLSPTIMIVEDILAVRVGLLDMLQTSGFHKVFACASAEEAMEISKKEGIDLVICDYALGAKSGIDLMHFMRAKRPENPIPFVVLSGRSDFQVIESTIQQGANAWLMKPVDSQVLRCKVLELLERANGGEYFDESHGEDFHDEDPS